MAGRVEERLEHNGPNYTYQSAHRRGHSTETAILKVQRNIVEALGEGSRITLIMLDLPAAFDVIDHLVLVNLF